MPLNSLLLRAQRSRHPAALALKRAYRGVHGFTLPAPRAVAAPMLWGYLAARSAYHFVYRVFVCEPLFKAYCARYGRGVRTGVFVHWVHGHGDIVLGDGVQVDGKCSITFTAHYSPRPTLEIGDRTYVAHDCAFHVARRLRIGRDCMIAAGTFLFEYSGHPTDPADRLAGLAAPADKVRPITIGDNVWIGTRCLIMPGVTVGDGSVVAAGSIVRGDVPPYTVFAGNPARQVAELRPPGAVSVPTPAGVAAGHLP